MGIWSCCFSLAARGLYNWFISKQVPKKTLIFVPTNGRGWDRLGLETSWIANFSLDVIGLANQIGEELTNQRCTLRRGAAMMRCTARGQPGIRTLETVNE